MLAVQLKILDRIKWKITYKMLQLSIYLDLNNRKLCLYKSFEIETWNIG